MDGVALVPVDHAPQGLGAELDAGEVVDILATVATESVSSL